MGGLQRQRTKRTYLPAPAATLYGGSGMGNLGGVEAAPVATHGRLHSLAVTLPPLAVLMFKAEEWHG